MMRSLAVFLAAVVGGSAFVSNLPSTLQTTAAKQQSSSLAFGIPTFQPKNDKDGDEQQEGKKTLTLNKSGFLQLLTAGMGSPFLGDYEGTDEETGTMKFSLEANNLVDENGQSKQTQMPYFESGWVDENDEGFKWPWQK